MKSILALFLDTLKALTMKARKCLFGPIEQVDNFQDTLYFASAQGPQAAGPKSILGAPVKNKFNAVGQIGQGGRKINIFH